MLASRTVETIYELSSGTMFRPFLNAISSQLLTKNELSMQHCILIKIASS